MDSSGDFGPSACVFKPNARSFHSSVCVTWSLCSPSFVINVPHRENKSQHASSCISHVVVRVPDTRAAAVKSKSIQRISFKFSTKFCTHTREIHSLISSSRFASVHAHTARARRRHDVSISTLVVVVVVAVIIHARRRRTFRHFVRSISFRCRNVTHSRKCPDVSLVRVYA